MNLRPGIFYTKKCLQAVRKKRNENSDENGIFIGNELNLYWKINGIIFFLMVEEAGYENMLMIKRNKHN